MIIGAKFPSHPTTARKRRRQLQAHVGANQIEPAAQACQGRERRLKRTGQHTNDASGRGQSGSEKIGRERAHLAEHFGHGREGAGAQAAGHGNAQEEGD